MASTKRPASWEQARQYKLQVWQNHAADFFQAGLALKMLFGQFILVWQGEMLAYEIVDPDLIQPCQDVFLIDQGKYRPFLAAGPQGQALMVKFGQLCQQTAQALAAYRAQYPAVMRGTDQGGVWANLGTGDSLKGQTAVKNYQRKLAAVRSEMQVQAPAVKARQLPCFNNQLQKIQEAAQARLSRDGRFCLYLGSELLLAESDILPDPDLVRQTDRVPCQFVNPGLVRTHPRLCGHFQDLLIEFGLMTNVAMTKEVITNF